MAANPIVVVDHGRVEIPEELQGDPRFEDGAKLELVPVPLPFAARQSKAEEALAWKEFRKFRGILKDSDFDPNLELEKEKQRELEAERR